MSHPALLDFAPLKSAIFTLYAEILTEKADHFPHMAGMACAKALREFTCRMPILPDLESQVERQ
jgi:hypothetical protein